MIFLFIGISAQAQDKKKFDKPTIVEASCGECQFGMKGKSCDLAVRIDGKTYFVDGTTIHDHGDSHADNGFCNAVRKASVTGTIEKDRFKATSFTLIDVKK
ncbi:hypothetical protein BSF42_25080 [Flavobacterium sp. ACN6]|nr:hypothetical protein BSF42_25080 [Flavobacterium sp. ACN6]